MKQESEIDVSLREKIDTLENQLSETLYIVEQEQIKRINLEKQQIEIIQELADIKN